MIHLKSLIREVQDFPKPGILFYDITTLPKDAQGLKAVIDGLSANYQGKQIDTVVGIEARGFIFAPAVGLTPWARALCRYVSRRSCRPPPSGSSINWNTVWTRSKFTVIPSRLARAC